MLAPGQLLQLRIGQGRDQAIGLLGQAHNRMGRKHSRGRIEHDRPYARRLQRLPARGIGQHELDQLALVGDDERLAAHSFVEIAVPVSAARALLVAHAREDRVDLRQVALERLGGRDIAGEQIGEQRGEAEAGIGLDRVGRGHDHASEQAPDADVAPRQPVRDGLHELGHLDDEIGIVALLDVARLDERLDHRRPAVEHQRRVEGDLVAPHRQAVATRELHQHRACRPQPLWMLVDQSGIAHHLDRARAPGIEGDAVAVPQQVADLAVAHQVDLLAADEAPQVHLVGRFTGHQRSHPLRADDADGRGAAGAERQQPQTERAPGDRHVPAPSAPLLVANGIFQELELHVEALDLVLAHAVGIAREHLVEPADHVARGFQAPSVRRIGVLQHAMAFRQPNGGREIVGQQSPHIVHAPRLLLDLAGHTGRDGVEVIELGAHGRGLGFMRQRVQALQLHLRLRQDLTRERKACAVGLAEVESFEQAARRRHQPHAEEHQHRARHRDPERQAEAEGRDRREQAAGEPRQHIRPTHSRARVFAAQL